MNEQIDNKAKIEINKSITFAFRAAEKDRNDNNLPYDEYMKSLYCYLSEAMQTFAQQEYNRGWDGACDKIESKRYDVKGEDGYIHHAIAQHTILSLKIKENEGE